MSNQPDVWLHVHDHGEDSPLVTLTARCCRCGAVLSSRTIDTSSAGADALVQTAAVPDALAALAHRCQSH